MKGFHPKYAKNISAIRTTIRKEIIQLKMRRKTGTLLRKVSRQQMCI
jgi:hypothetical protein